MEGETPPCSDAEFSEDVERIMDWDDIPMASDRSLNNDRQLETCIFTCMGECTDFESTHSDTYARRSAIARLKAAKTAGPSLESFKLFENDCHTTGITENMEIWVNLIRMSLNRIEHSEPTPTNSGELVKIRKDVRTFFYHLSEYVIGYLITGDDSHDEISVILNALHTLSVYFGRISDISGGIISNPPSSRGNHNSSSQHHLFHLYLEVMWSMTEIYHIISLKYPHSSVPQILVTAQNADCMSQEDFFSQWLGIITWDLVLLAMKKFEKTPARDRRQVGPCHCSCVKELLILLIHLMEHRQQTLSKPSFWIQLNNILEILSVNKRGTNSTTCEDDMSIDSYSFCVPPRTQTKDVVGFCLWVIDHLSRLSSYTETGCYTSKGGNADQYLLVRKLLRKSLQQPESLLRCHLGSVIDISLTNKEPDVQLLFDLWEQFYKKMNDLFKIPSVGISGIACVEKSARRLFDRSQNLIEDHSKLADDNSYQLFLRLVSIHVGKYGKKGPENKEWQKVKGRFLIKFHKKRMLELTDVGIGNLSTLFHVLSSVADLENAAGKYAELVSMLEFSRLDPTRKAAVWRGMFSLVLLCVQQPLDASFLTSALAEQFNVVCRHIKVEYDLMDKSELWNLVHLFLDSTVDVFETSQKLTSSENKLIGTEIVQLFNAASENNLRKLLQFACTIINRHRTLLDEHHVGNNGQVDYLWTYFFDFVKGHSTTQTPPAEIADIAAEFALLLLRHPPSKNCCMREPPSLNTCVRYFGWNENVNVSVSCGFLARLLPESTLWERLSPSCPDHQELVIQAWFRCCWHLPSQHQPLTNFTGCLLTRPKFKNIFTRARVPVHPDGDYSVIVKQFIEAIGRGHANLTTLKERIDYKNAVKKLIGDDVMKTITSAKNSPNSGHIKYVYKLAGQLVKHCARMVYARNDNFVVHILDRLVVPRAVLTGKDLTPQQQAALKESLPLYVEGIATLDYRTDTYLQRKIKDIIIVYLPRFSVGSRSIGMSQVHPLLTALHDSCRTNTTEDAARFREHFLGVLRQEYLTSQSSTWQSTQMALLFLLQLFEETLNPSQIARDAVGLLAASLSYNLNENSQIKGPASQVMRVLLEAMRKSPDPSTSAQVTGAVSDWVAQHMLEHQARLLRVMDAVAQQHPRLVARLVSPLTRAIKDCEKKRGVGVDKQLRFQYSGILRKLGDDGKQELAKISSETL